MSSSQATAVCSQPGAPGGRTARGHPGGATSWTMGPAYALLEHLFDGSPASPGVRVRDNTIIHPQPFPVGPEVAGRHASPTVLRPKTPERAGETAMQVRPRRPRERTSRGCFMELSHNRLSANGW